MKQAIPYYRVSTDKQGRSGLGLEAQKNAVKHFAIANRFALGEEYIEVESGKKNNRVVLALALDACKKQKATLLIAKLDRLARNVAFISKLMEAKVDFVAVDNPSAIKIIVHILAAFAEHERDEISARTIAALQAAKERGVELGSYGKSVLSKRNKHEAENFAKKMKPTIIRLYEEGFATIRQLMKELNRLKIPTPQNKTWHVSTVHTLLKRINKLETKH